LVEHIPAETAAVGVTAGVAAAAAAVRIAVAGIAAAAGTGTARSLSSAPRQMLAGSAPAGVPHRRRRRSCCRNTFCCGYGVVVLLKLIWQKTEEFLSPGIS
jgi:hypothetical protein